MSRQPDSPTPPTWQRVLHEVIFEADTLAGKLFDVALIITIVASVLVVMMDSVASYRADFGGFFMGLEWLFTILFTVEYILRLAAVGRPLKYALSFFGVVDLLAVLPTYISLLLPGTHYLLVIRVIRILRIFRVFKLVQYVGEANALTKALRASSKKITVFLFAVTTVVIVSGSLMYILEGESNGFTSIPRSIYWAIVTLTTVGYGDISPATNLGQAVAAVIMITGYSIIAVPTGIVTVEMARVARDSTCTQVCPECSAEDHESDARYCKHCGARL